MSAAMPATLAARSVAHTLVVHRVVGDVAGTVLLLETSDAVGQTGRTRNGPGPGEGLRVPEVGPELLGAVGVRRGWSRWRKEH